MWCCAYIYIPQRYIRPPDLPLPVLLRQTSSPARTVKAKRAQLLNWLTVRSGCLRSLTWLLLHRRREIAQGAASILRAVASCPGTARWVISFVEQGCVPVLWMAAAALQTNVYGWTGRVGKEAKEVDSPTVTATVDTPGGGRGGLHTLPPAPCCSEHARCPCTSGTHTTEGRRAWTSDYERVAAVSVVGPNCQETAKFLLKVIAREVCTRHADRLVRAVNVSGNRELRSNLALGLVLLSAESASRHFDEVGGDLKTTMPCMTYIADRCIKSGEGSVPAFCGTVLSRAKWQSITTGVSPTV